MMWASLLWAAVRWQERVARGNLGLSTRGAKAGQEEGQELAQANVWGVIV